MGLLKDTIIGDEFIDKTGFWIDEGEVILTNAGREILKDLQDGQDACIEYMQEAYIDEELEGKQLHFWSIYLRFQDKDTLQVEFIKTIQYGFEDYYPDSPAECEERNESEYYTYSRKEGESDIFFIARVVDFLNSEFN